MVLKLSRKKIILFNMYIPFNKNFLKTITLFIAFSFISSGFTSFINIKAEDLQSTEFEIKDAGISNSQGTLDSSSLSLIGSLGSIVNDVRLTSGTYEINSGSGVNLLNVPKVQCFETNTIGNNTNCLSLPNSNGMQGECGGFGCYSKAKLEIDAQENPFDTLYLVKILDVTDNITYYLKSDHTLGLTYTISNFLSKCAIEGKDSSNPDCDQESDSGWNINLQSTNIFYLDSQKSYSASVKALNGDYTETTFGNSINTDTTAQALALDLDIGPSNEPNIESSQPYNINIMQGTGYQAVQTSTDLLWFNFNTNNPNGFDFYVKDKYNGLYSQTKNVTIPSVNSNLATDNDAGYGIKIFGDNITQTTLGPLLKSIGYNTSGENEVGSLTTANKLLFSTNTSETGKGEIYNGRGAIVFKVKTQVTTPISGDYTDELYFTIIGNY